jgi:hypothetical protein
MRASNDKQDSVKGGRQCDNTAGAFTAAALATGSAACWVVRCPAGCLVDEALASEGHSSVAAGRGGDADFSCCIERTADA